MQNTGHVYTCTCMHSLASDQRFPDRVVSMSEVGEELPYNGLSIGVVAHGVEQVNSLLTNTDVSFRLGRSTSTAQDDVQDDVQWRCTLAWKHALVFKVLG